MIKNTREISLSIPIQIFPEDKFWIAYCPILEISGYGDSEEQAKESFEVSLKIFIDETVKKGTLEKILLDLGWSLSKFPKASYKPPKLALSNRKKSVVRETIKEKVLIPY